MTRVVGIDLGTSKSVVCVLENGRPRILANAQGARYTPSVVGFKDDGSVIVGQKAADQAVRYPERTATAVRRRLGTDWCFTDHGTTYTAPQIAACVLRKLKRDAQAALGAEFTDVVLSVPAHFGEAERRATLEAAQLAGLRVLRLVGETNLAGFAYAVQARPAEETVLVLDLGAGTFSVSLLAIGAGVTEVRAVAGDNTLGGDNWDERLAETLVQRLRANAGIDISGDSAALQRIRAAAELAKIELSGAAATSLNLPYSATDSGGNPLFLTENITRADFIARTADLLDRCRTPITKVIADAGISMRDIDRAVLIGGASRMPAFAALVSEMTGREPYRGVHPEESVALGAAALTGVLDGSLSDQLLVDDAVDKRPGQDAAARREQEHTAGIAQTPQMPGSTPQFSAPQDRVQSATSQFSASQDTVRSASSQGSPAQGGAQHAYAAQSGAPGSSARGARDASAPDQPSPLITEAAAKYQLGQHISTHPHRWYGGKGAWIIGIPVVLLGGLIIAAGITDGVSGALGTTIFFAIVAVLVWVRKAISSPRHTLARVNYAGSRTTGTHFSDAQLSLYEHGAVVLSGGRTSAFRWQTVSVLQDVTRISHRTYGTETGVSMTYRYQLTDPSGDSYLLTHSFNEPHRWGPAIQDRVTAAQLPGAIAAVNRGESLEFGSLALNSNQVLANGQAVPWARVEEIRVKKGFISIRVAGQWLSLTKVTVSAIPNVFVFLELAERLRTAAAGT
ncbi:DUF6585 family protein [Nocardia acidivorans]|uniref:DUF6585 family protein n=1 Tax=Nocardia acidivorans TaxID=404580 RepID=UPI00082B63CD|nr:DUF6585 family protein [Nocardia acidivorans]